MKKFLKIAALVVGVILLILILSPVLFEKQLKNLVLDTINDNLNAEVVISDIDLSLFRNFPDATLGIKDLRIINKAPFEGDTLISTERLNLEMSVAQLFRDSGKPLKLKSLSITEAKLNILVDSLGNSNYDIALKDTTATKSGKKNGGFQFDMQHYEIKDSYVRYADEGAGIELLLEDLNHKGSGDLSTEVSTLSTVSSASISFLMDSIYYMNRNSLLLDADFKIDLANQKYSFLENEAHINKLPLTFEGFVQVNEDNNEVALNFQTPTSSFRNFMAVIPEAYSKNIEEIETQGDFMIKGFLEGIVDDTHIPKMEINVSSINASFKYPDLPKKVEDIQIAAKVINKTGLTEDTFLEIDTLNFRIDEDIFRAKGKIGNLAGNMQVNLDTKGTINLSNLEKAYPLELEQDLNGIITADVNTTFDMESLEKEQYQNVKSNGTATVRGFSYTSPEIPNEIRIEKADLAFQSGNVQLRGMKLTTGQTDLSLSGSINNLMGYLFTDQLLKGTFTALSNTFIVNDFMVKEEDVESTEKKAEPTPTAPAGEAIKIPSFLDVTFNFLADKVLYDNLVLENARGSMVIADETATLNNVKANIFNGTINLNGSVSTGQQVPLFGMELDLNAIDIAQAFADMELLQNLAPIAEALQGKLTTEIDLRGRLKENLTPRFETLAGDALARIVGARLNPGETPVLSKLDQNLDFLDLENLSLQDLSTRLRFYQGQVLVQPFDFNIKGISGRVSGKHGFDQNMNYQVTLDVPAKYLGSQIGEVFSKLSATAQDSITVALPISLTGTFADPQINLDLQQATQNLTRKLIETQKKSLKEKGKSILTDIITRGTQTDTSTSPTRKSKDPGQTQEEAVRKAARDILGGLFGNQKKEKDTTNQ